MIGMFYYSNIRFGAQVGSWSHLSTSNEFVRKGVYDILYTHVHILFAQTLGWFLHLRSYNYSFGMGTLVCFNV